MYILPLLLIGCVASTADKQPLCPHYTPKYAEGFTIDTDTLGRKILTITNPYQSDKPFEQRLYLLEQGQTAPATEQHIVVPATKLSVVSSSHIGMLAAIGAQQRIVGVSGVRYVTNADVRSSAAELGTDTSLDFERIKALGTQIVLLYALYGADSATTAKLTQLGIPYIYIGDYIESSPLARAEWIVALAAICGMQEAGEEYFRGVEQRYNEIKARAASYSHHPKVMCNTPYNDTWFMPPVRSYAVQLIADAGGEYIYPQNTSAASQPISLELALLLANKAEVWINVGQTATLEQLKRQNPKFATVPAVLNGRVYNNTKRATDDAGSDFWESGCIDADIVLSDMVKLLHNNATTAELYYYKQLE